MATTDVGCLVGNFAVFPDLKNNPTLLSLAKELRSETVENLKNQLHFVYMAVNEDFPWESDEFEEIEENNLGFCENIILSNIGSYPFPATTKLCKSSAHVELSKEIITHQKFRFFPEISICRQNFDF